MGRGGRVEQPTLSAGGGRVERLAMRLGEGPCRPGLAQPVAAPLALAQTPPAGHAGPLAGRRGAAVCQPCAVAGLVLLHLAGGVGNQAEAGGASCTGCAGASPAHRAAAVNACMPNSSCTAACAPTNAALPPVKNRSSVTHLCPPTAACHPSPRTEGGLSRGAAGRHAAV